MPMGSYCVETATGDFNGDGRIDFASANYTGGTVGIRLNLPEGYVVVASAPAPSASNIVTGDFNGDGKLDLAVTSLEHNVRILLGNGNGTFPSTHINPVPTEPRGLVTGDFNEDGITDIAVASTGGISVLIGLGSGGIGNGTFAPRVVYGAAGVWGVTTADVNSDGILDLAAVGFGVSGTNILLGRGSSGVGDGTFDPPYIAPGTSGSAREIIASDFNADGIADFAVAGGSLCVLIGQGAGGIGNGQYTSVCYLQGHGFNGVTAADFNRDGLIDLAASDPSIDRVQFLRGVGNGAFLDPEAYVCEGGSIGITQADLDQNGGLDLLVSCSGPGTVSILPSTCAPLPVGPPVIAGFTPPGGQVGTLVAITGSQLADVTSVEFHDGVQATTVSSSFTEIHTIVPAGAATGPIRVTNPQGSVTSAEPFFVGAPPVVTDAAPRSGKKGASVTITGDHFTGAVSVTFGGTSPAPFTLVSDDQITAIVNPGATTGPIRVTTLLGIGTSTFDFTVLPPDTAPRIADVRDVPNDQGGKVVVEWLRSDLDAQPLRHITGYRVWRRAPLGMAVEGTAELLHTVEVGPDGSVSTVFWEALVTLPAAYLEGYAYVAPTTQDSLEGSNPYTAFFVQALTSDPFLFYSSAVDSAYSVDNLSPATPALFAGEYHAGPGVALHWSASLAPDLFGYRLHRGAFPTFVPDPSNLLSAQPDTGYFDPQGNNGSFYKLAAVDLHGNLSNFALVTPDLPTATLASVVSAEVDADGIRITWDLSANPDLPATIYRRTAATSWTAVREAVADGNARIVFEDTDVVPGGRYGYRLGILDAGVEVFVGEAWVESPAFGLAIASVRPNPAPGRFEVHFTHGGGAPARLELHDVTGRRVATRDLAAVAGRQSAMFDPPSTLPPGIYLLRLIQGGTRATAKVALLD